MALKLHAYSWSLCVAWNTPNARVVYTILGNADSPVQSLVYEGEVQYTRPTKLADALSTLASQPDAYILSANTG